MICQSTNRTIRKSRTVQIPIVIQRLSNTMAHQFVRSLAAPLNRESSHKTLNEFGTHREPASNKPVSGWQDQHQLGKLGCLDPVKPDGNSAAPLKTDRYHLICRTVGPILKATHPLHPSWKRSSTLSMTCIIGGSFFCTYRKLSASLATLALYQLRCNLE